MRDLEDFNKLDAFLESVDADEILAAELQLSDDFTEKVLKRLPRSSFFSKRKVLSAYVFAAAAVLLIQWSGVFEKFSLSAKDTPEILYVPQIYAVQDNKLTEWNRQLEETIIQIFRHIER